MKEKLQLVRFGPTYHLHVIDDEFVECLYTKECPGCIADAAAPKPRGVAVVTAVDHEARSITMAVAPHTDRRKKGPRFTERRGRKG